MLTQINEHSLEHSFDRDNSSSRTSLGTVFTNGKLVSKRVGLLNILQKVQVIDFIKDISKYIISDGKQKRYCLINFTLIKTSNGYYPKKNTSKYSQNC